MSTTPSSDGNHGYTYEFAAGLAASLLLPGLLSLTCAASWWPIVFAYELPVNWPQSLWAVIGISLIFVSVNIGLRWLAHTEQSPTNDGHYGRYLVGVGYALSSVVLVDIVLFAGLARRDILQVIVPVGIPASKEVPRPQSDIADGLALAGQLLVALLLAVSGVLFYVANSLRKKRDAGETFNYSRFWAGLWFRLGEVSLFTLMLFVISRWQNWQFPGFFLPGLALLIGMFVKSGEQLVFGLAERIFAATASLLPDTRGEKRTGPPEVVTGVTARTVDANVILSWNGVGRTTADLVYEIEFRDATGKWTRVAETHDTHVISAAPGTPLPWDYRVVATNSSGSSAPASIKLQ